MNTAFKFEVTNTFYKDVEDAINFLIKKKKISTYTNEQIVKIAYEIHNMNWSDLVNFSNKHYTNDWSDILWFSYENMINLLQPFLDEIEEED
tara:strand:+ start:956 stop:1231 length:276 start_codon:yes stop_codon:yes gene_type:complete